jgi:cold shock CspA family protein
MEDRRYGGRVTFFNRWSGFGYINCPALIYSLGRQEVLFQIEDCHGAVSRNQVVTFCVDLNAVGRSRATNIVVEVAGPLQRREDSSVVTELDATEETHINPHCVKPEHESSAVEEVLSSSFSPLSRLVSAFGSSPFSRQKGVAVLGDADEGGGAEVKNRFTGRAEAMDVVSIDVASPVECRSSECEALSTFTSHQYLAFLRTTDASDQIYSFLQEEADEQYQSAVGIEDSVIFLIDPCISGRTQAIGVVGANDTAGSSEHMKVSTFLQENASEFSTILESRTRCGGRRFSFSSRTVQWIPSRTRLTRVVAWTAGPVPRRRIIFTRCFTRSSMRFGLSAPQCWFPWLWFTGSVA